jgi:hypothetical protein
MRRVLVLLVALAACQAPEPDGNPPAADTAAADTTAARARPAPVAPPPSGPSLPYVAEGACPFECCTYGTWTTTAPLPVRAQPDGTAALVFTMAPGTAFEADSGNVYVTRPGLVVADASFALDGGPTVAPGDTLYVLDDVGEGYVNAWYRGTVYAVSGEFWNWGSPPDAYQRGPFAARLLRPAEARWWAHVRADGREGWVDMDAAEGGTITGVDACG